MRDLFIGVEKFKIGFYALEDTTKSPLGSFRIMKNVQITDRGGIAPRPGTELLSSYEGSSFPVKGFYNFRKSFNSNEILMRANYTDLSIYSKNHPSAGWFRLKRTFTSDKEFGFITSLVNTDKNDYVIFNNRYDDYSRWNGAITQLNGALVGGETDVTVDSVLTEEAFYTGTATANSATTVDVAGTPWAASQWVNFYVYFPSTGKVRLISSNTSNQLTFSTLGAGPGNIAFEIRQLAFPLTGTVIYNNTTIAYTTIDVYNKFPVSSAHAAADNTGLALVPDTYPANPRGNRLTNYLNRIIVGNVRSALARDTGGALQGYSSAGSYFVSKINTPTDFTFSATRVAGEGDIIGTPYGGGDITDIQHQEENAYIFKKNYIESVSYSQDANDLAVRVPLKQNVGSVGPTIKGSDDIYFITDDKKFTSIGRVRAKDLKPQTENIGFPIKRYLDMADFSTLGRGIEYKDKIYIPFKSDSSQTYNNVTLVYNKITGSFEGIWDLAVFGFERFNDGLYYAESNGNNVYKMLTGFADVVDDTRYPIVSEAVTHFFNLTAGKTGRQAINGLMIEGYIRGGTTITYSLWKDFSSSPFLTFTFASTEEALLDGEASSASLGGNPLAINPLSATFSEPDSDGRRHFRFNVYFPFQYGDFFSWGQSSSGADFDYETIRIGLSLKEDFSPDNIKVKQI